MPGNPSTSGTEGSIFSTGTPNGSSCFALTKLWWRTGWKKWRDFWNNVIIPTASLTKVYTTLNYRVQHHQNQKKTTSYHTYIKIWAICISNTYSKPHQNSQASSPWVIPGCIRGHLELKRNISLMFAFLTECSKVLDPIPDKVSWKARLLAESTSTNLGPNSWN